ncbi:MAG: 3-dehydroquinate synthase [Bacteroidales bacterium]|nr:3-dehydroquinate synthase [Bacteroidales bacterium]
MNPQDIIYQPVPVKSFVIVGKDKISSAEQYLIGLLLTYKHLYAFIDKQLMMKSQIVRDLAVELQEIGCPMRAVEATEEAKTMDSVLDMCSWLMEKGADRDAVLVAIGGGITTDMVGFAAGIYKRGVRYVNVPSTLLAQVDAALGGKSGVNFEKYKNMLGVIRQPSITFIWPSLLTTLPRRDFLSGAAEMLKTFMIEDNGNYQKTADLFFDMSSEYNMEVLMNGKDEKKTWAGIMKKHMDTLCELIGAAANVKAGVVSHDPFEKEERRKLNLGHTFAHAIETLAQRDGGERFSNHDGASEIKGVTHGEAVAMGLVLAARLADRYFRKDKNDPTELEAKVSSDLWDADIPCYCPYTVEEMAETMKKDKKAEGGKIHFVLPKAVGDVKIVDLTVEEVIRLLK